MRSRNVVKFQVNDPKRVKKSHFNIMNIGSNNTFSNILLMYLICLYLIYFDMSVSISHCEINQIKSRSKPGTPALSSAPNTNCHDGWGQPEPLPGREHIHGLPGFRTERPWDPGSEPHCMAAQSGGTCVLMLHYIIGPTGSIMNMMMICWTSVNAEKTPTSLESYSH